jgi:hypothetical protein
MLYDDIQQLEVRYVISLDYHDVDIYSGSEEELPEGELWVKRNAIRLKRKEPQLGDKGTSLPFFLFGENVSEKEDFYHALLKNQQKNSDEVPEAEDFDVKYIVGLVQKLHSSEEQLQTRWLNAMIGRLFLAIYKTPELEEFIRAKLMKKISRVKKPNFITKLSLLKIDTGSAGPFITNPRLKDLTVNGDCMAEADVEYTGNFRLEVGATARIDLGKRFGAREVDMVLAVTVKKLQGRALARFKPPPTNRIWVTFEKMPQLDLVVEPVVSSRQITYTIILRAIESRIREVIAESLVLPFWDDIPFLSTRGQKYRGGIWKQEKAGSTPVEIRSEEPEDEAEAGGSGTRTPETIELMKKDDRNMSTLSMPLMTEGKRSSLTKKSVSSMNEHLGLSGDKTPPAKPPRVLRSPSFATAVDPKLTANHADNDASRQDGDSTLKRESAATILKDLSTRSTSTPTGSQGGSPPVESSMASAMKDRSASITSKGSSESMKAPSRQSTTNLSENTNISQNSRPTTPSAQANNSRPSSLNEDSKPKTLAQTARSMTNAEQRKQAIASAAAAAQKWSNLGWGVIAKNRQKHSDTQATEQEPKSPAPDGTPSAPMGRGQPLPPPGMPLPKPQKPTMMSSISNMVPQRKPTLPKRPDGNGSLDPTAAESSPKPSPKAPTLPDRRRRHSSRAELSQEDNADDLLVVEAPTESAPASPAVERRADEHHDDFFGHGEEPDNISNNTSVERSSASSAVDKERDESEDEGDDGEESAPAARSNAPALGATRLPTSEEEDHPAATIQTDAYDPTISNSNTASVTAAQPPKLPPRSPTVSIKRKPLRKDTSASILPDEATAAGAVAAEQRPMSPEACEAVSAERQLGMMEGASWGGGYNE